jgi:hypothetical protein
VAASEKKKGETGATGTGRGRRQRRGRHTLYKWRSVTRRTMQCQPPCDTGTPTHRAEEREGYEAENCETKKKVKEKNDVRINTDLGDGRSICKDSHTQSSSFSEGGLGSRGRGTGSGRCRESRVKARGAGLEFEEPCENRDTDKLGNMTDYSSLS